MNSLYLSNFDAIVLIEQMSIVTILIVTVSFFLVLLVLGILKSYKLKDENDRLSRNTYLSTEDDKKVYKDFREGHLYDNY
jgi:preprotein translocase subunit SecG